MVPALDQCWPNNKYIGQTLGKLYLSNNKNVAALSLFSNNNFSSGFLSHYISGANAGYVLDHRLRR